MTFGLDANIAAVVAAILSALSAIVVAVVKRPPVTETSISVKPNDEFKALIDKLDESVDEARITIGELTGRMKSLQDLTKAIPPLGERLAVVESQIEDVVREIHKIKHSMINVESRNRMVDQLTVERLKEERIRRNEQD